MPNTKTTTSTTKKATNSTTKKTTTNTTKKASASTSSPKTTAKRTVAKKPEEVKVEAKKVEEIKAEVKEPVKEEAPKETKKENKKLSVLFAAGEAAPFIKTGGLADVAGTLPRTLAKKGLDVIVIIPLYGQIKEEYRRDMKFIGFTYVPLAWRNEYCGVFKYEFDGVKWYFLDNQRYFNRAKVYGEADDGERFAFFSKAILESLKIIDFYPDIIHANDWHTGMVPVYLDCFYRDFEYTRNTKSIFTIHNIEFQGKYDRYITGDLLGLDNNQAELVSYKGLANYMKGGIECANFVTTVSYTYASEILDSYFGYGMEDILRERQYKLRGIINGINNDDNNPLTDKFLFKNYSLNNLNDKIQNKLELQKALGLEQNADIPLIASVGRLTHQKGIDLILAGMDRIIATGAQVVILGSGDANYENALRGFQARYGDKFRAIIGFSVDMASKLYAGSDLFLMPSKFEPCGLSQMIAMRYGSVPIVRETGGLKDTVIPYNHETGEGVGFTFKTYNVEDMVYAVERAVGLFFDYKEDFHKVLVNAMSADYDWSNVADKYISLYKECFN